MLPTNVSTGTIQIRIRTIGLVSAEDLTPEMKNVNGKVTFFASPAFLLHTGDGLIMPPGPISVYLEDGDATVTLMATDDVDVNPINFSYEVSFDLEGLDIPAFHITVPSGSDRELADIVPVPASDGQYYLAGPQGPKGDTGAQGPAGSTNVPALATAPVSPVSGQMYLDTSNTATKGLRYWTGSAWATVLPFGAYTSPNPFGGRGFYRSTLDNAMFRAEARWVVTGSTYLQSDNSLVATWTESQLATLFNGDYETGFDIPAGQYLICNINFNGGNTVGYPYGNFYVTHYHSMTSTAVAVRVYCNYAAQGIGWKTLTVADEVRFTNQLIQRANNQYYNLTDVEFTITGQAVGGATARVSAIEWSLDRPGLNNEMPVLNKYATNSLYSTLNFKGITNITNAYIDSGGNASFANIVATGTAALPSGTTVGGAALVSPSHTHGLISAIPDTRAVATLPNDYTAQARWQFKQSSAIGLPGGSTTSYVGLYGQRCYVDGSGDWAQEIAYWGTDIYRRHQTGAGANTWTTWAKMPTALPRTPYVFSDMRTTLTVGAGTARIPNATGRTLTIVAVRVDVATAPTGAGLIVDVNKNGTSILSGAGNRAQVLPSTFSASAAAIDTPTFASGDYLTVDIDQVGSTAAGGVMTVTVIAEG